MALVFLVLRGLGQVLTPIVAALIISYLLDPVVTTMARRLRIPRWAGTLILFLLGLLAVAVALVAAIPALVREIHTLGEYVLRLRGPLVDWCRADRRNRGAEEFHSAI